MIFKTTQRGFYVDENNNKIWNEIFYIWPFVMKDEWMNKFYFLLQWWIKKSWLTYVGDEKYKLVKENGIISQLPFRSQVKVVGDLTHISDKMNWMYV